MLLPSSSFTSINVQPPLNRLGGGLAQFSRLETVETHFSTPCWTSYNTFFCSFFLTVLVFYGELVRSLTGR